MNDKPVHRNLIDGEWVASDNYLPNINPSDTNDVIGWFPSADAGAVDAAVSAARAAFPAWRDASPQLRADLLDAVGTALLARREEFGRLLSREEGKPLTEGIGEVARAGQIFKYYAQEALRVKGDALASVRAGVDVEVVREPLGVVALVTPWNFPIAIPAWKVAPALAYGNCVVLKPAEITPACALILAQLLHDAGCPPGVFNLVVGPGAVVGQRLAEHPEVNAVSFTGSVGVGRGLLLTAAQHMKKIQLEMGGKNPLVVMDDANLDLAVQAALNGAFFSTGQRCTASSRLIVQSGIHDAFVEKLAEAMTRLAVGDALDPSTEIGPVVSERQLASNLSYVALARAEGAEVVGGARVGPDSGYFQAPALFIGAHNTMRIAREEIFGPCATVLSFGDFAEGLALANDSEFGLSSGICTTSLANARRFKRESASGMVMINLPTAGVDYHVPFGGRKGSSYGSREQGSDARDFYTITKTAYIF